MSSFLKQPIKQPKTEPLKHKTKRYIGYGLKAAYASNWFPGRARNADERHTRTRLLQRFRKAVQGVPCEHQEREFLLMADYILLGAPAGDLVECGCSQGGATVKLSILAAETGRKLYVCDSFTGLPQPTKVEQSYRNVTGHTIPLRPGMFAATLDQVRSTVASRGEITACEFVPGLFRDSLPTLDVRPALVFSDAKLISSTLDVLRFLWPRIVPDGRYWLHDSAIPDLVYSALDPSWWQAEIGAPPPVLFGAGWGLGFGAENIAFAEKRG